MNLYTERLNLEILAESDMDFIVSLEKKESTYFFERISAPDDEFIQKKYRRYLEAGSNTGNFCFVISLKDRGEKIGKVTLNLMNEEINEWEIGWALDDKYRKNGFASEAAKRVLDFAFSAEGANRIVAFGNAENTDSENVMKRIGMKKEGRIRETKLIGNRLFDEIVYSVLKREYEG